MKKFIEMTVKEFKQRFREDGKGKIAITFENGETEKLAEFEEVVCDYCNAEITETDFETKEPNKVFMTSPGMSMAVCKDCAEKYE